eukprot:TRINITY_DN46238_c0_g1_i1.p1 TRINITY_DN46238_c0_g1~~TRINITY_DN46238_c0_g1_i1.p1  ORF type:complete len:375 (+),score=84.25 TRINITY_DN46238_c0_g1_i1:82-1206(+)
MAMHFLRRIGDILETEDAEGDRPDPGAAATRSDLVEESETEAEKEAGAAAKLLKEAAAAAEAIVPKLPAALRRARIAEAEVERLKTALADAEARIESIQSQQLRLAEGFQSEIQMRDAEIDRLRKKLANPEATQAGYLPNETTAVALEAQARDVLTLTAEGPLGLEFDRSSVGPKILSSVDSESQASQKLSPGDEVISVNGTHVKDLTWEEFDAALATRPVVMSVRRSEAATGRVGLAGRVRSLAGWTKQAARAAARELEAAMAEEDTVAANVAPSQPHVEDEPAHARVEDEPADAEARNRPFYDLVRASMAESRQCAEQAGQNDPEQNDARFERWLRHFHNERDDEWYANNHSRVYNAFRPHWDEVQAEAHRK